MSKASRRPPVAYPDAPLGTCRHCGGQCRGDLSEHEACKREYTRRRAYRDHVAGAKQCAACGATQDLVQDAEHVIPIADGGPHDWTTWRCRDNEDCPASHRAKSRTEATQRAARRATVTQTPRKAPAKSGGKKVGARPATAAKPKGTAGKLLDRALIVGVGATSGGAGVFAYTHDLGDAVNATGAVAVVGSMTWFAGARYINRLRAARQAKADALQRALLVVCKYAPGKGGARLAPDVLKKAVVGGWVDGPGGLVPAPLTVVYPPHFEVDDAPKALAALRKAWLTKTGVPIRVTHDPVRDTLTLTPADPGDPDADPDAGSGPARVDAARQLLADVHAGVSAVLKKEVETRVLDGGDPDRPTLQSFTIEFPAAASTHRADTRAEVDAKVDAMAAPVRYRPEWTPKSVTYTRRPDLPSPAYLPPASAITGDRWRIPLGPGDRGEVEVWDLRATPHMIVAGATGSGKSVFLQSLALVVKKFGFRTVLIDGKGTKLAGMRVWPNTLAYGLARAQDTEPMADAILYVEKEMRERYDEVQSGRAKTGDFEPIIVIIDEYTAVLEALNASWANDPDRPARSKSEHPASAATRSLARLAREANIYLVVGIQQAAANIFAGTEARDNFGKRVALGPTTAQSAQMLFADASVGRSIPATVETKGRATVQNGDGRPVEIQGYLAPECDVTGAFTDAAWAQVADYFGGDRPVPSTVLGAGMTPPTTLAALRARPTAPTPPGGAPELVGPPHGPGGPDPVAVIGEEERAGHGEDVDLLCDAAGLVITTQFGSTSMLQRKLRIGYAKAMRVVVALERAGVLGSAEGSKAREVLVAPERQAEAVEAIRAGSRVPAPAAPPAPDTVRARDLTRDAVVRDEDDGRVLVVLDVEPSTDPEDTHIDVTWYVAGQPDDAEMEGVPAGKVLTVLRPGDEGYPADGT